MHIYKSIFHFEIGSFDAEIEFSSYLATVVKP